MPNNTLEKWEEKTIDEIAYIKGGKRLPKGEKLTTEKTGHPYIRVTDFNDFGTIDVDNVQFITDNIYEQIKNYTITSKDLYISIAGTIGKSGIIPKELDGANLTENACKLVYKSNEIFNKYIYYYTQTRMFAEQIFDKTKMAAMPKLALTRLATVKLPIPPLSEQQRIVGILDEAFENIEKAKQNTLQNLNNAKELYKNIQSSIFNEPFEEKELGEICTLYQGLAINAKTKHLLCDKSTLPLLRIKDLKENCETQFVKEEGYPENALVNENDIIYTRTGSLGLVFKGRRGILHNNSFKVIPNNLIDNDYLFEWLQNPIFNKQIIELAQRAAQPDITHALFKQQIIYIPPLELQLKKVKEIRAIREYVEKLEQIYTQKLQDLDELKQSILQKAFNGEL